MSSKMIERIDQFMIRLMKNVEPSNGITNFSNLLHEIEDEEVVGTTLRCMNQFMDAFKKLTSQTDLLTDKALVSKILSYEFIKPQLFFGDSRKLSAIYIKKNRVLVNAFPDKKFKLWEIGHDNHLGNVLEEYILKLKYGYTPNPETCEKENEECRKVILLWNYLPMVVKAILQTKKRSLGIENNSSKFPTKNDMAG